MKLISWNVNGIRAVERKGVGVFGLEETTPFPEWLIQQDVDLLFIQETKSHKEQLSDGLLNIDGYESHWCSGERKGYSGVGTYSKHNPLSTEYGFASEERFDAEGRLLIHEFDAFTVINCYFPNGGQGEERLNYKLDFYAATMEYCDNLRKAGKEVIICGDVNTCHNEIDIARPKQNEKVSGFMRIERDWLDKFEELGYTDSFRKLNPEEQTFSWWSYRGGARERNVGWRLDYFYVTPGLVDKIKRAEILTDVTGSDHCPILLEIDL